MNIALKPFISYTKSYLYTPRFVGALHCNFPYEVSVSSRGFMTRIWY